MIDWLDYKATHDVTPGHNDLEIKSGVLSAALAVTWILVVIGILLHGPSLVAQ